MTRLSDKNGVKLQQKHKEAWVGMLFAYARLIRQVNEALAAEACVPMDVYDVLIALEDAPGRRLTMKELAEHTVLSPSGVTRLVDRMEHCGYVQRIPHENDRRSMYAQLTDEGYARRVEAWPVLRKAIERHFACHLSHAEAVTMAEIWTRIVDYPRYDS